MQRDNQFPRKTLNDLEWHRLLDHLAGRCTSEEAAKQCKKLPFLKPDSATEQLSLVSELMSCIAGGDPPPPLPAKSVGEWTTRIRSDGTAPGEALRNIASNLKLFVAIARYLENRRDVCPKNAALLLPDNSQATQLALARLAAEIDAAFEPDGTLADSASAELGRLRRDLVNLRKRLISRIEKMAEKEEDLLQERTITLRNDRFVLPVRADAHRRLPGIVHGASSSGATVFVEPEGIIESGNELMLRREEIAREEARILAELCGAVGDQIDDVELACKAIVTVEVRIAVARLAIDLDASVPGPADPGTFDLIGTRHPLLLLDGVSVVPCRLSCSSGNTLILSGPNAGGKTVVLKTVGLLGLMLAAGLPIPVNSESRFGAPTSILTDIGDDQSLENNLSTFSAHMTNIAAILAQARAGAVVLLDEIAAGTDPGEGNALAQAILEFLNQRQATTLTTTHFDALKTMAQTGDRFINASVGFDLAELQPTFELTMGIPGSSSALAVARRFGAPETVIDRAEEIIPQNELDLARAIKSLESARHQVLTQRSALAEARRVAEQAERRAEAERARLKARQEKLLDEEAQALWSNIKRAREKVREAEQSLRRRKKDATTITRARRAVNEIAQSLDPGGNLSRDDGQNHPGRPATASDIQPGATVYVTTFGKTGIVESALKSGRAFVRLGGIKTRVKLAEMRLPTDGQHTKRPEKLIRAEANAPHLDRSNIIKTTENTVDLRGMIVDEAVSATDAFLDRALETDQGGVFIIHGHGTGALRDAIRAYLSESRYVDDFRKGVREEGGDGVTVAFLK